MCIRDSSSTLAPRLAARPRTALRLPQPPRFPFHPDPLEGPGRRQRPGAGDRARACLGYGPTRRDPPDGARMTPADRTAAIREPAAGGGRRPTALPRPLGSLAPLRAQIKVPILRKSALESDRPLLTWPVFRRADETSPRARRRLRPARVLFGGDVRAAKFHQPSGRQAMLAGVYRSQA